MKAAIQASWTSRKRTEDHQAHHHPPLTPSYTSPRIAPRPSSLATQSPLLKNLQSAFLKKQPQRVPSENSLHSAYTSSSNSTFSESLSLHPYAAMLPAPLPVVSNQEHTLDEEECPVCLESLNFSFRLPGEKPPIVPECGHALHAACFSAVYGPPPNQIKGAAIRKANLGVCGICRRPMKLGDGDGGKSHKLAALTGMGASTSPVAYSSRENLAARQRIPGTPTTPQPFDPTADDPIDSTPSIRSPTGELQQQSQQSQPNYVVSPSIQVRPEFSTCTRNAEISQPLTCIVVIELPGKKIPGLVPGPVIPDNYGRHPQGNGVAHTRNPTFGSTTSTLRNAPNGPTQRQPHDATDSSSTMTVQSPGDQLSRDPGQSSPQFEQESPPSPPPAVESYEDSPLAHISEDLRNRITDWKGQPLTDLGPLQMYDLLHVRRDALVREFFVYLFKEAIICVVEEKKRTLGRLLSSASNATSSAFSDSSNSSGSSQSKAVLRLKGRIFIRHIKQVTASSAAGEMSLTIDLEEELASFILIFKDRSSLEAWKTNIQALASAAQEQARRNKPPSRPERRPDIEDFGGSTKAARMLSGSTDTSVTESLQTASSRSTLSSSTSYGSLATRSTQQKLSTLDEDEEATAYETHTNLVTPYMSSGPSNSLTPLPHPPLDLILVISLPPPSSAPSTASLKVRVIRHTLEFIVASLGSRDRLSLVTFEVGVGGKMRKTPFLCVGKQQSRARLGKFIELLGDRTQEDSDEFLLRGPKDEKTDVVTAVNHGLDVVLQRKARNSISGMVLVSDASDTTRRAQMDLVLARAEAANIPIHSFGYGRSHDPASLWLMSNHTSGTYTFVKDWYDLRDCVAGCVGGMMSIGLLNMKLHMKVVDGNRFRIRKVSGGPSSVLSSDGQNVDVDVGELRFGERKEMLLELELDNSDVHKNAPGRDAQGRPLNATDAFVQSMGLDSLSFGEADLADGLMDRMIDEVPVVEVDGSFFDPAASKQVSRLAHPVLLTVTLLPPSATPPRNAQAPSDPVIVRRRMELLASDMITRALVLASRKNYTQAQKIMGETKRILHTVLQTISRSLPASTGASAVRNRKEILTLSAVRAMQAILQDLQILSEALEENVEMFAHDQRNLGAQQAMILRDQKSWSGRSATERLFWTTDNSIDLVARSTDWVASD